MLYAARCRLKKIIYIFLFAVLPLPLFAQNKQISGRVTDEKRAPLEGVTVVLKGTSNGATTGSGGTYKLNLSQSSGTLVFSIIGYLPQEVSINNNSIIDIT